MSPPPERPPSEMTAAKTPHRAQRPPRRPADAERRKRQAAMAAEKRMRTGGRSSKARLAELTAELDTRRADVYTTPPPPDATTPIAPAHRAVGDLADALRGL